MFFVRRFMCSSLGIEGIGTFSDSVFAVTVTLLVRDFKAPELCDPKKRPSSVMIF